jgi:hypothetical protein
MWNIDIKGMFQMILFFIIIVAILMFLGGLFFGKRDIKSEKPIKPKIELVIKNNKVDTVYIYERP